MQIQTKEFIKLLGIIYETKECNNCHEDVRYQVIIARQWKTFLIPIYPITKKYFLCCPKCGSRVEIDRKEARQYLDSVAKEKKDHRHKER